MKKETLQKLEQAFLKIERALVMLDDNLYFSMAATTRDASKAVFEAVAALKAEEQEPAPQPQPPTPTA